MTKNQQIQLLQAKLELLPKKSPRKLWILWKILIRRNAINRTILICGLLGTFAAALIFHQIETVDRHSREETAARLAIDTARQVYDAKLTVYELNREEYRDCRQGILTREHFRSFVDTITNNVLLVAPNSSGAITFSNNLQADKEKNWKSIDPMSCGAEPTQPDVPQVLKELEVPVTTTLPPPLNITTTEGP